MAHYTGTSKVVNTDLFCFSWVNLKIYRVVFYHNKIELVVSDQLEAGGSVPYVLTYTDYQLLCLRQCDSFFRHPQNESKLVVLSWTWWERMKWNKEIYELYRKITSIVCSPISTEEKNYSQMQMTICLYFLIWNFL